MDLRIVRAIRKLRQWDITEKTGIPQSRISLIENGMIAPKEDERKAIARALEMRPEEIEWKEVCG